jgi:ribosomal protein L11 methyltransferase
MLRVMTSRREEVTAALFACGAPAVQENGDSIVTHLPSAELAAAAASAVRGVDAGAAVELEETPLQDWSQWRASVRAWEVGALTVAPPWLAHGRDASRTVVIEPAMAFGTGEHATTRGVLLLLQRIIRDGDTVADLGAGSGVLAIAGAKLGASRIFAIEDDADAVANAEANVAANGVSHCVTVIEGDAGSLLPLVAPVRIVLANIASLVLISLLPAIRAALTAGGAAVLSGILVSERARFSGHLSGWHITEEHVESDWWTVALVPR